MNIGGFQVSPWLGYFGHISGMSPSPFVYQGQSHVHLFQITISFVLFLTL